MSDDADRLTLLTTLGVNAVKTYKRDARGRVQVEGYGRAKRFTAREIAIDPRGRWLEKLAKKTDSFVVMGKPQGWAPGEKRRRLSSTRDGDAATIVDVKRAWMPIDIDTIDFEPVAGIDDGDLFAIELLDRLGLKGVGCVWHLTNSHGFFDAYRARLWVPLAEAIDCEQMRAWAKARWGDDKIEVDGKQKSVVDFAVYRPAQPIYTGDPLMIGVDDPVTRRVGFVEGDRLKIKAVARKKRQKATDENVALLQEAGLYIGELRPGQHMIMCPWEDAHSGEERDDDTFYFEPHFNGHDEPAFKCHHDSCSDKRWGDLLDEIGDGEDDAVDPSWVFVHRLKAFWDARDGALIDKDSYDATHGGATKRGTPTQRFLASKTTAKADAAEFVPGQPRFVRRGKLTILNTYIDRRIDPDYGIDITPWEEHLEWLIPGEDDRENLSDWLAWSYQRPGHKITWAPVLYSRSAGVGKTTVFNCLTACIGREHVSEPTQAELEDRFNDWCYGKLLVKIEELMSGDKYHVAEKLKPIVANPTVSVRGLYKAGFTAPNVANVCASTNHIQALPIEKGDRRWMLVQCVEADVAARRPKMRGFHRWLEEVGHGGIAAWLADRDVSSFSPTGEAPYTALKASVIDSSATDLDRAIDMCDVFDRSPVVSSLIIAEWLMQQECSLHARRIGLVAAQRGWKTTPEARTIVGGRKITLWTPTGDVDELKRFVRMKPSERDRAHANLLMKLCANPTAGNIRPAKEAK